MISSQLVQQVTDIDEVISTTDRDFQSTGLKQTSVVRVTRLAVVDRDIFMGALGAIAEERLARLKQKLANWLLS